MSAPLSAPLLNPTHSEALYQCRNCRATGSTTNILADAAGPSSLSICGQSLTSAPLLPRCSCFVRLHKGKLPPAITSLLASVPDVPALAAIDARAPSVPEAAAPAASEPLSERDAHRRLIFSMDGLPPSRSVSVYRGAQTDDALLGSIAVTSEHKLSDVAELLSKELKVGASAQLYRGTRDEALRVPLHKQQYRRLALPFFPSDDHCIIVGSK